MSKRWIQFGSAIVGMIMIANLQYAWTLFVVRCRRPTKTGASRPFSSRSPFSFFWKHGSRRSKVGSLTGRTAAVPDRPAACWWAWAGQPWDTPKPSQLDIFYGIAGVGAAFVYSGSIATALKWFPDIRGRVSGFITAGLERARPCSFPRLLRHCWPSRAIKAHFFIPASSGIVIIIAAQFLHNPGPDFMFHPPQKRSFPRASGATRSNSTADK